MRSAMVNGYDKAMRTYKSVLWEILFVEGRQSLRFSTCICVRSATVLCFCFLAYAYRSPFQYFCRHFPVQASCRAVCSAPPHEGYRQH